MKPIRLLVYAPVIGRGGVHRLVEYLIPTMLNIADSNGIEIKILSHARDENGIPINWPKDRLTALKPSLWDLPNQTRRLQYLQETSSQYYKQLETIWTPGDVVWLPHPWFTMRFSYATIRRAPVHFVPTIHDMAFDTLKWGGAWGAGYRHEMLAFAHFGSRLIFSSNTMRDIAMERYFFPPTKARTVYLSNFLPESFVTTPEAITDFRTVYHVPRDYLLAFHCSSPSKDLLTIIRAVGMIRKRNSSQFVPLVIAGIGTERFHPNSTLEDEYAQSIRDALRDAELQIDQDVFILGDIHDPMIGGLYAGATATITASLSEAGLSGTLFEAFYAHSPAIFSDIPQFTERLGTDNLFGLHFRKGNPEDLARAIIELLGDRQLTHERSRMAYDLVSKRTWQHIAQEYMDVFQSLAGIDAESLRKPQIPFRHLTTYVDTRTRFFHFRVVRFFQDRVMPRLRLSTHFRWMQAEVILTEVTAERNAQRKRIELLEQENRQLREKVEHFTQFKSEITNVRLDEYIKRGSTIYSRAVDDKGAEFTHSDEKLQAIKNLLGHPDLPLDVLAILSRMPQVHDKISYQKLRLLYDQRLSGENSDFWDVRMALNALSRMLFPQSYIEIGTSLGWSLAQVFAHSPNVRAYCFDKWSEQLTGSLNLNSKLIQEMMNHISTPLVPQITFISDNVYEMLPEFFNPQQSMPDPDTPQSHPFSFDLIAVNGDHCLSGLWLNMMTLFPHVRVGGAFVLDGLKDIVPDLNVRPGPHHLALYPQIPHQLRSVKDTWDKIKIQFPNFAYIENGKDSIVAGIAVRLS